MLQTLISLQQQSNPRYDRCRKTVLAWIPIAAIIAILCVFMSHLSATLITFIIVLFMTSFTLYYFYLAVPVPQLDESQNYGPTGLSSSDIKEIHCFAYDQKNDDLNNNGCDSAGLQCAICISTVNDGDMVRQLLMSKHAFHANCIDTWLLSHSTCPMCREDVKTEKLSAEHPETLV